MFKHFLYRHQFDTRHDMMATPGDAPPLTAEQLAWLQSSFYSHKGPPDSTLRTCASATSSSVKREDLVGSAAPYYKESFDATVPLSLHFKVSRPWMQVGHSREFFSAVLQQLATPTSLALFEGSNKCRRLRYCPQTVLTGLSKLAGRMVAHAIALEGIGFPY